MSNKTQNRFQGSSTQNNKKKTKGRMLGLEEHSLKRSTKLEYARANAQ
jgi:hypothetical protein